MFFVLSSRVSINSTSEEVRRKKLSIYNLTAFPFPLIQLPRKSEDYLELRIALEIVKFPLIQLPRKSEAGNQDGDYGSDAVVSINSTSEEVRSKDYRNFVAEKSEFPLIQLPRKSEAKVP